VKEGRNVRTMALRSKKSPASTVLTKVFELLLVADHCDLYEKLDHALKWYLPTTESTKSPKFGCYKIYKEVLKNSYSFTDTQIGILRGLAVKLLKSQSKCYGDEIIYLCYILASAGASSTSQELETGISTNPHCPNPIHAKPHMILIDILREVGVFRENEEPLYYDLCEIFLDNKTVGRHGFLILTSQRLFVVGRSNYGFETSHRLSYGECWKTEPWLQVMDYVELKDVQETYYEEGDELAYLKYRTEYLKTKVQEFYGPLWIRFPLPEKHALSHGEVIVSIQATRLLGNSKDSKKDSQRRMAILAKKMDEIWSQL